ncbi:alkyl sulfatase dimerization domain-containing protein [Haloferula chungangensis]|uniref:Alkyl sulfatase dimerization domain-containing protein n=1 Tax=Haloferula chungangensis TaxID=1048331 RepID=A0ABW2L9N1_9BACT
MKTHSLFRLSFLLLAPLAFSSISSAESEATRRLIERNAEFRKEAVKVADGVYSAVGYRASTINMIEGDDGIIIVDTGQTPGAAKEALAEFRKLTDKPVKAIIFTHSHGDHIGGASIFAAEGEDVDVWARENFGSESGTFSGAGLTIHRPRGSRQAGALLPADKKINNGVAPAVPDNHQVRFGKTSEVMPTRTFESGREKLTIAGVKVELVAVSGETDDALYVWLPEKKVLFSGDNFYKSWPNAYAIRGTAYRDIRSWADANDAMLQEGAEALVPGHTRPIVGAENVKQALTDYRDAIRFVFDKTIEGMNQGMTPDELVDYVKLPAKLAEKDYLGEYYGNVEWAVRAIFQGYLGWFDGNPTNLFPLSPKDEAERMAKLAGGKEALLVQARLALKNNDAQWAAQLSDQLIALDPEADEPKLIKADALSALAEELLTATGRNYYFTVAQELRKEVETQK